jgi:transposase
VSVSVFPGNTNDSTTLLPQVDAVRSRFGIDSIVIVGDRGMISQKQIQELYGQSTVDWITALRSPAIRDLVVTGALQLGLFDERNLFEFEHPEYPGERLVACRNGDLAAHRAAKRQALLEATAERLERVRSAIASGRLRGTAKIGVRVGRVIHAHKVGKLFDLDITDTGFEYAINQERVAMDASLDGVYVLRTSLPSERADGPNIAEAYKMLSQTERAFRSMKTAELHVRPIRHWAEPRVRAHIFLCMLAYYVQYHMQEAWRSLLFFDEEAWTKERVDPVAPAERSASAERKAREKVRVDGQPVHSFRTLLANLGAMVCNVCRRPGIAEPIRLYTKPSPLQREALGLLESIRM